MDTLFNPIKVFRKVVVDTETTGLNHYKDRIVSICAQEIVNNKPGISWHSYINPEGVISNKIAQSCHKIKKARLDKSPTFIEIYESFVSFIGISPLVIHNAQFDIHFINSEFKRIGKNPLNNNNICTLKLSRNLYPKEKNTLDALCDRYNINKGVREKIGHGSFIDTELLSQVYLEMINTVQKNSDYLTLMKKSVYMAPKHKWEKSD